MEMRKFTQFGTLSVSFILPFMLLSVILLIVSGFNNPGEILFFGFISLIFLVCLLIFYKLTIYITGTHLGFRMGVGLVGKKIPIEDIKSCTVVTNPFYYGVGIRLIPGGWLYNVSGSKAIELTLNSNKVIRIGTNKPEEIALIINFTTAQGLCCT